ncbi:hypothetical protein INT43_006804 [Umbelopsis isabellina]|uniref:Ima1 N-terminal domain-containing protein n=1 Tax=Mortierella isabellina TaxID=91625 RepID=A0A8H7Q1U2_MORIS|nr:hypothetical protein INT43_006804 [Umbelopsis isabellina]
MHDLTLNHPSRVVRRPSANKATNALCSNCDLAQQRILSYITAFDPDDNDKDYLVHANGFRRKLEERYPLCPACQQKVNNIINERDKIARSLMIDRCRQQLHSKPVMAIPSRSQARRNFILQGVLYWTLHIASLLFSIFTCIWPKDAISYMSKGSVIPSYFEFGHYTTLADEYAAIPTWSLALLISILSWFWATWHPYQMEVYGYSGKYVHRLGIYQKLQIIIYIARIAGVLAFVHGSKQDCRYAGLFYLISSAMILGYSLNMIEVRKQASLFEKIQSIQEERRRENAQQSSQPYDFNWDDDLGAQSTPMAVERERPALRNPQPRHYAKSNEPDWNFSPQSFFPREAPTGLEPLLGDMNLADPNFFSRAAKTVKGRFVQAFD